MENELPKTEAQSEPVITVPAVEEKKEETPLAVPVTTKGEKLAAAKKCFMAKMDVLKVCMSKMTRTTKTFVVVLAVFAVLLGVAYYFKGVFIAATVNGEPISRLSVVRELEKKAGKNFLDTLVTKKLIEDEVKKEKVVVTAQDVDVEIKKVEAQITAQGGTLDQALEGQGMTLDDLREQIMINKELEKLLGDKIAVSDDEVDKYISTNKIPLTKGGSSEDLRNQTREQLKGQKFNTEAAKLIDDLRTKATINYYTQY